jgi:SAM-dependent methyltransferase
MQSKIILSLKNNPFVRRVYSEIKAGYRYWVFLQDYRDFSRLAAQTGARFSANWNDRFPIFDERTAFTAFDAHYIYHPAWAARIVKQMNPALHVDISSSLSFSSLLSAFIPVDFFDYRPVELNLNNLRSQKADLLHLPFDSKSIESLSCMHVVEHIGLGRYGDPLDPEGDLKAIEELKRVLKPGGSLLFVTPVGQPRIVFNAHRIYSYDQIVSYFLGLEIKQFALVDDNGIFKVSATPEYTNQQKYGCGCWWFSKPNNLQ